MNNTNYPGKQFEPASPEESQETGHQNNKRVSQQRDANSSPTRAQLRRETSLKEALKITGMLNEPNVASVQRMLEIFGPALVNQKASEAVHLYLEAQRQGPIAYSEPNTSVATGKSKPRTLGGVFFFLIKQHCANLGLDWEGLKIASTLWYEENRAKRQPPNKSSSRNNQLSEISNQAEGKIGGESRLNPTDSNQQTAKLVVPSNNEKNLNDRQATDKKELSDTDTKTNAGNKPGRIKATLLGHLLTTPKFNPLNQIGIVELQFKVEMNQSLPKGLPNLGESRVVVWCTKKQYEKVISSGTVTSQTRFVIEGEPFPAVGSDLKPFMRFICTRLSTVEIEQARQISRSNGNSVDP